MAASKVQVIHCGTHHVSTAIFKCKRQGELILEHLATHRFESDFSNDRQWLDTLEETLKRSLTDKPLRGPVSLILPGRLLLAKRITAPYIKGARQTEVILYEARQNIPYSLSEVVIDYHVLSNDGIEVDVLVAAAKLEIINDLCSRMKRLGIQLQSIRAAPVLYYNAFRFAYPKVSEDTLLIHIGIDASHLLFLSQKGFYLRTIALSGKALPEKLADPSVPFFTENEKVTFSQNFMAQLSRDINRFIVDCHYHHEKKGRPSRIFLTGLTAHLPGLKAFLNQDQNITVDYFDPTRNLVIRKKWMVSNATIGDPLSAIVGEASAPLNAQGIDINLLPKQMAAQAALARHKPFVVLSLLCLAIATLFPLHHFTTALDHYRANNKLLREHIQPLHNYQDQIATASKTAKETQEKIEYLERLLSSRSEWVQFFADLQSRLHAVRDVWLNAFETIPYEANPPHPSKENNTLPRTLAFKWRLSGQLLVRSFDPAKPNILMSDVAIERIETLLESLKESPFIRAVEDLRFDTHNPRILKFQFHLIPNTERAE